MFILSCLDGKNVFELFWNTLDDYLPMSWCVLLLRKEMNVIDQKRLSYIRLKYELE
jgi:hypothetical protein